MRFLEYLAHPNFSFSKMLYFPSHFRFQNFNGWYLSPSQPSCFDVQGEIGLVITEGMYTVRNWRCELLYPFFIFEPIDGKQET